MLQRFFQGMSQLAVKLGIKTVVVIAVDPQTGVPQTVASPGAMDALRSYVAAKWKLSDPNSVEDEVEWPAG